MVDIDQAMASIPSSTPAETSEPAAVEPKNDAPETVTATAPENKDSGSANQEPKAPEAKDAGAQNIEDRLPKSNVAFQRLKNQLNRQIKSRDEGITKLTDALSKFSGVKYDPKNGDLDAYINAVIQKRDLENSKAALEDDSEIEATREQLRDLQAKEVYGHDERAMKLYESTVKPRRPALYAKIKELDPSGAVLQYLNASRRAPILEVAFLSSKGMELFKENVTDDPYVTKRNLERLETEMNNALAAAKPKQQTQPAPVSTPSVNSGTQMSGTKNGPSLGDVAKWF